MVRLIPATIIACAAFAFSAQAGTVTLDFEAIGDGGIVSDGSSSTGLYSGISISAFNIGGGPDLAVAYDSTGAIGRDNDLEENRRASKFINAATDTGGHTGFGNLLIVQENDTGCSTGGTCDDPDDEAGGGYLRFAFEQLHLFRTFDYFDVDGAPDQQAESISVKLFTTEGFDWSDPENGTDVLMVDDLLSTGGDNTFRTHAFDIPQLVYGIEFAFTSSGAIDNLVLETPLVQTEVPAPGAALIFLVGALGLIGYRRRHA